MRIYLNIPVQFHPDLVWNDGALGFLKRSPQQEQQVEEWEEIRWVAISYQFLI